MTKFIDQNSFKLAFTAFKDFVYDNTKSLKSWVNAQLEKVNAKKNWEENDPTSIGYIENRTHYKGEWSGEKLDDSYVLTKYKTITLDHGDCDLYNGYFFTGAERKKYNFSDIFLIDESGNCIKPCKITINNIDVSLFGSGFLYQLQSTPQLFGFDFRDVCSTSAPYVIETYYYYSGRKLKEEYLNKESQAREIKFGDVVLYTGEVVPYEEFKANAPTSTNPTKYIAIGMVVNPEKRTFIYTCYKPTSYGTMIELPDADLLKNPSGYSIKKQLDHSSELYTKYTTILDTFKNHKSTFYSYEGNTLTSVPDFNCFIPTLNDIGQLEKYSGGSTASADYPQFLVDLSKSYCQQYSDSSIFYQYQNGIVNYLGRTCTKIPTQYDTSGNTITCVDTYPLGGEALTKASSDAAISWCGCQPFYLMFGIY